ncbi:MAG TPA: aspartyl/asparaginyl beta-hydroxylase domain-containing protein [Caulobacteraceae bacterium]|jgi:hypothetical protein|nr:aspartyl/asparaginyl beta-hydroxylase domain-containing protein [Caulobacteraceae bacterium]
MTATAPEITAPSPFEQGQLQEAKGLFQTGRLADAETVLRDLLRRNSGLLEGQALLGTLLFQRARFDEAAAVYAVCMTLNPSISAFPFNLGTALEKLDDKKGAVEAYLEAWRLDPRNAHVALFAGAALDAAGRHEDAAAMFALGDDHAPFVRRGKDDPSLPAEMRNRSRIADRVMREHFTRLHAASVDESARVIEAETGAKPDLDRVRVAMWTQTHDGPVSFRTPMQEPSVFYMPDLKAQTLTPAARLAWATAVEAATTEIRDEFLAAVKNGVAFSPYVHGAINAEEWKKLSGNLDWSSLHLYREGRKTPIAQHFPKTLQALEAADIPRVDDGNAIEMFFSRLKPGAHIPPHFGCANNRITVHLPLIVPGDCAIRVGNDMHHWREGELFAFDDSFEHEAWNRSDQDRVVLIFESHHPDLTKDERFAVERAYADRGGWVERRAARFAKG